MAVASAQYDYTGPKRQNGNGGGAKPVYGPPMFDFGEPIREEEPLPPVSQPPQQSQPQPQQPQQPTEQAEAYTPQLFKHVCFKFKNATYL